MVPPLYGRLIARWRHGRWCHRYGNGSCFNSTRGHMGSLLVYTEARKVNTDWLDTCRALCHLLSFLACWICLAQLKVEKYTYNVKTAQYRNTLELFQSVSPMPAYHICSAEWLINDTRQFTRASHCSLSRTKIIWLFNREGIKKQFCIVGCYKHYKLIGYVLIP